MSRLTSAMAHYMAAPPLRGPGCQRWEGDVAAAPGSVASWRWGNAHDTVASLVLVVRPTTRLMTGHSFSHRKASRPTGSPPLHLALWSSAGIRITDLPCTGQVFLL